MSTRRFSRRTLAALALFGSACLVVVACSDSDDATDPTSTTVSTVDGVGVPTFSDPTQLVNVPVGRRFAVVLPADPAHGWRWVAGDLDTALLAPLGSEFRDDASLLAQATTTTTTAPPPPPEPTIPGTTSASTTSTAPTTVPESTTTTAPGPLVQILSYAGTGPGVARLTLRYEQIGSNEVAQEVTFEVVVGTPPPLPPASEATVPG